MYAFNFLNTLYIYIYICNVLQNLILYLILNKLMFLLYKNIFVIYKPPIYITKLFIKTKSPRFIDVDYACIHDRNFALIH